ncbi:MAG: ribosome-associated translation inhibitor RaiA [Roseibium sp.]|uniref:ribosome hibernation-promoting factor, HPF/YfiA family n=1 Tax=Roseibium sp. TaxID=1936156 RepID=UPI001AFDAF62|nr:ribosome-associated translation inhibitor RaiA [Roseibium sp.]MBO6509206.1 ribosome-associated translation inhibitor RaiA [Roseibium sp.]MBO6891565.1 ribosome-associated translation inhibitor RaiA [Roseibium sp.]MBO6933001.1 ribosome-associated translation inhibitor RaiA [Roseibium sp.]
MALRISGKNVDVGDAMREHITDRIEDALSKYFTGGFTGHVTMSREGTGFKSECSLHLDTGIVLQVSAQDQDPRNSFDQAADKIEKRLRRYKRKLKDHHSHNGNGRDALEAAAYVLASPDEDEEVPADFNPLVIAETSAKVKTMTVGMAVMELDLTEAPVVMFKNAANGGVNVVYRRQDGNIGWIDPALVASEAAE